jgi:hypothetical protein
MKQNALYIFKMINVLVCTLHIIFLYSFLFSKLVSHVNVTFLCAAAEIEEEKERESFYNFLTQQKRAQEKRVSAAVEQMPEK